jgi:hypothetical protein
MHEQANVNRFVVDYLRHGPAPVDDLYSAAFGWDRVPRGMVDGALMHFKVKRLKHAESGARYVELPEKIYAIWWGKFKGAAWNPLMRTEGSAAGSGINCCSAKVCTSGRGDQYPQRYLLTTAVAPRPS